MPHDDRGRSQAFTKLESIKESFAELNAARRRRDGGPERVDEARRRIAADALSISVRSNWHGIGVESYDCEYRVLLCTDGPAVQIVGKLNDYGVPESARIEYQDWETPWTTATIPYDDQRILIEYASTFYYGEGS